MVHRRRSTCSRRRRTRSRTPGDFSCDLGRGAPRQPAVPREPLADGRSARTRPSAAEVNAADVLLRAGRGVRARARPPPEHPGRRLLRPRRPARRRRRAQRRRSSHHRTERGPPVGSPGCGDRSSDDDADRVGPHRAVGGRGRRRARRAHRGAAGRGQGAARARRHRQGAGPLVRRPGAERRGHRAAARRTTPTTTVIDAAAGTATVPAGRQPRRAAARARAPRASSCRCRRGPASSPSAGRSPATSTARTTTSTARSASNVARLSLLLADGIDRRARRRTTRRSCSGRRSAGWASPA